MVRTYRLAKLRMAEGLPSVTPENRSTSNTLETVLVMAVEEEGRGSCLLIVQTPLLLIRNIIVPPGYTGRFRRPLDSSTMKRQGQAGACSAFQIDAPEELR